MQERQLITLGLGNYASLVAAQWANGTSKYDVHHSTLYHERHLQSVLGGQCMYNQGSNDHTSGNEEWEQEEERAVVGANSLVRVPRLLLLDAPYASFFTQLSNTQQAQSNNNNNYDINEENHNLQSYSKRKNVSSVDALVRQTKRQWWKGQRIVIDDEDESESDSSDDNEKEEEDQDINLPYHHSRHADPNRQVQQQVQQQQQQQQLLQSSRCVNVPGSHVNHVNSNNNNNNVKKLNKKLFRTRDTMVPWWRYITTGVDVHSVTTLRPLHTSLDYGSEVASLHSVGYGLSHLASNKLHSTQMQQFTEALRHELELCEHTQGLQCFVDADGCFAGAAHNLLQQFAQDVGRKTPVALFALFQPPPWTTSALHRNRHNNTIPFVQRRVDETHLNRLLSTSMLSSSSSLSQLMYIPLQLNTWSKAFQCTTSSSSSSSLLSHNSATHMNEVHNENQYCWLQDDRATAQYIAAISDTVLYGIRDGSPSHVCDSQRRNNTSTCCAFHLSDWVQTLKASPAMRIAAITGCLPLQTTCGNNTSNNSSSCNTSSSCNNHCHQRYKQERRQRPCDDLWNVMQRYPLLPHLQHYASSDDTCARSCGKFVPLTHAMRFSPFTEAGRVLSHTFTLRGVGNLPCRQYPWQEAMARYALPLSTYTYLPLITQSGYPVSSTFPCELLTHFRQHIIPNAQQKIDILNEQPKTLNIGAQVCTTYGSADYIEQIVHKAQAVFAKRFHVHKDNYYLQFDEWKEQLEEVWQIRDDYRHGEPVDDDYSNNEDC